MKEHGFWDCARTMYWWEWVLFTMGALSWTLALALTALWCTAAVSAGSAAAGGLGGLALGFLFCNAPNKWVEYSPERAAILRARQAAQSGQAQTEARG